KRLIYQQYSSQSANIPTFQLYNFTTPSEPKHQPEREVFKPRLVRAVFEHVIHIVFSKKTPSPITQAHKAAVTHFGKMVIVIKLLFTKFRADLLYHSPK